MSWGNYPGAIVLLLIFSDLLMVRFTNGWQVSCWLCVILVKSKSLVSRWFVNEGSMGKVLCVYRSVITAALVTGQRKTTKKRNRRIRNKNFFVDY